jgi:glycosyltransferase involved in cell wall biosynthesis
MHVLMLGWEFPPFITGGLGTACYGLTRALDRRGTRVTFVLPKSVESPQASHVTLLSPALNPQGEVAVMRSGPEGATTRKLEPLGPGALHPAGSARPVPAPLFPATASATPFQHASVLEIPSGLLHPYQKDASDGPVGAPGMPPGAPDPRTRAAPARVGSPPWPPGAIPAAHAAPGATGVAGPVAAPAGPAAGPDYGGDLMQQVSRYASFCAQAVRHLDFDVIHAHDWMTYPAGQLVARMTGRPLVTHIHSTEFDRSGDHVNQAVYDIERRGMHAAMRVIAVSQLTRNLVVQRYGLPASKVEVVYNGVEMESSRMGLTGIRRKDKIVLYFGRITYQKGPEYFIAAAKRVLEVMDDVKFVIAGSGDMARRMIEMAAELGIGSKVLFTGFLRGADIPRVFALADLYVMPSVSEPFGIAPLEAMSHNVPALISRTSGVSEVLSHVLKVDFWDVDDMANKIIAVLRYPPLSQTLREHGAFEVRQLTWDGAAQRCERVYQGVVREMPEGRGRART